MKILTTETLIPSSKVETKKHAWNNIRKNEVKPVVESSGECSICFQPWLSDKVMLEECGHCFHSEVILQFVNNYFEKYEVLYVFLRGEVSFLLIMLVFNTFILNIILYIEFEIALKR